MPTAGPEPIRFGCTSCVEAAVKRGWMAYRAAGVALLLVLSQLSVLQGQADQRVDTEAGKIFENVMSPYCPGRTLANCPSPQAAVLQDTIKAWLRAGVTPDSVMEELYGIFGDEIRSTPRASGFGLLAWVTPGLFLLVGAAVVIRWARRARLPQAATTAPSDELSSEAQEKLEAEFAKLDSAV